MEIIRKIVELDKLRSMLDIPKSFQHTKVEILILPLEDQAESKLKTFNPKQYYGVSHIPDIEYKIKEIRDEWDR